MSKYKSLFLGVLVIVILAVSGHMWRAHKTEQQRSSADRFLDAAIKENQNCLRKLSGWRDHLTDIDNDINVKLNDCRLKSIAVEITNVPKAACIGLAERLFKTTSKTSDLKRMTLSGNPLNTALCADTNAIQFDFETTEAGLTWYQKIEEGARRRELYVASNEGSEPQRPDLNIGTIIARLKRLDNESLYDFTVSLENGTVLIITQEDDLSLNNGDSVMVIHENGQTRIRNKISP